MMTEITALLLMPLSHIFIEQKALTDEMTRPCQADNHAAYTNINIDLSEISERSLCISELSHLQC